MIPSNISQGKEKEDKRKRKEGKYDRSCMWDVEINVHR
jgi:hypothetical protein